MRGLEVDISPAGYPPEKDRDVMRSATCAYLQKATSSYLAYFVSNKHTYKAKRHDFASLLGYLSEREGVDERYIKLSSATPAAIGSWYESLLRSGESPATARRRLATVRHFFRALRESDPKIKDPTRAVRAIKVVEERPRSLSLEEVGALYKALEGCRMKEHKRLRLRALISLYLYTGLRPCELLGLKRSQLLPGYVLRSVVCKGLKVRTVYVPKEANEDLERYLRAREERLEEKLGAPLKKDPYPLFISCYEADTEKPESFSFSYKALWSALSKLCKEAGIEHVNPHALRHTFAHHLLEGTKDIRLVSQALGHSSLQTTMRYTERGNADVWSAVSGGLNYGSR